MNPEETLFPCLCSPEYGPEYEITETEKRLAARTGFTEEFVHGFMDLWSETCEEVMDEQWAARG